MTAELKSNLVSSVQAAAELAGLVLVRTEGSDFHGQPTAVFQLGLAGLRAWPATLSSGTE
jgi:hypothetical protein